MQKSENIRLHYKLFPSLEYSLLSRGEGAKKDSLNGVKYTV